MNNKRGGHSNRYIDYKNIQIKDIQHNQKSKLFLINNFIEENTYVNKFFDELDNLLVVKDGKINVDFLNNFHVNIYSDIHDSNLKIEDQSLKIIKKDNKYIFKNNTKYEIIETIAQGVGSGSIILKIKKKDSYNGIDKDKIPNELILKAFPYSSFESKAYLSLEIFHITNKTTGVTDSYSIQNNYAYLDSKTYELVNKNSETSYDNLKIKTKNQYEVNNMDSEYDRLFLACKNDNFHNEIIVNLILQKIYLDYQSKGMHLGIDNFIKYKQFYFSTIEDKTYGFLVMDYMDGNVNKLLSNIDKENKENEDIYKNEIDKMLNEINKTLTIFKNSENMFTHTDMKLENIFYKNIKIDDTSFFKGFRNDSYTTKYFIADFDKSSVTYNGIRFYNDLKETSCLSIFSYQVLGTGTTTQTVLTSNLVFEKHKNIGSNYESSFSFGRKLAMSDKLTIPTETLALRYVAWPFYIGFDYQSLLLSLCALLPSHYKTIKDNINTFKNYFTEKHRDLISFLFDSNIANFINIMDIYTNYVWSRTDSDTNYDGNFTKLLFPLMIQDSKSETLKFGILNTQELYGFFLKEIPVVHNNNISDIILLSKQNKLILGLPFRPNILTVSSGMFGMGTSTEWNINLESTKDLYIHSFQADINKIMDFFSNNKKENMQTEYNKNRYKIYYNGNAGYPNIVVLTNRYSSSYLLYEYDDVDEKNVYYIYKIYENILLGDINVSESTHMVETIDDELENIITTNKEIYNKYMKYKIKYKNLKKNM